MVHVPTYRSCRPPARRPPPLWPRTARTSSAWSPGRTSYIRAATRRVRTSSAHRLRANSKQKASAPQSINTRSDTHWHPQRVNRSRSGQDQSRANSPVYTGFLSATVGRCMAAGQRLRATTPARPSQPIYIHGMEPPRRGARRRLLPAAPTDLLAGHGGVNYTQM